MSSAGLGFCPTQYITDEPCYRALRVQCGHCTILVLVLMCTGSALHSAGSSLAPHWCHTVASRALLALILVLVLVQLLALVVLYRASIGVVPLSGIVKCTVGLRVHVVDWCCSDIGSGTALVRRVLRDPSSWVPRQIPGRKRPSPRKGAATGRGHRWKLERTRERGRAVAALAGAFPNDHRS